MADLSISEYDLVHDGPDADEPNAVDDTADVSAKPCTIAPPDADEPNMADDIADVRLIVPLWFPSDRKNEKFVTQDFQTSSCRYLCPISDYI